MLEKITVALTSEEKDALKNIASSERRHYRSQAAVIIRQELERRGLLQSLSNSSQRKLDTKPALDVR